MLTAKVEKTLSVSATIMRSSRKLLSTWPVNGRPTLSTSRRVQSPAAASPVGTKAEHRPTESALEQVTERSFAGETVLLDGRHFIDCVLDGCTLQYNGGPLMLEGTHFKRCQFSFGGEAALTVSMLKCFGLLGPESVATAKSPSGTRNGSSLVN